MPRLSRAQERARQRIARLATGGYQPEQLGSRLLAALEDAIPSDGQRLFGLDPETLLFTRLLAASASDVGFRMRWLREFYLAPQPIPYFDPPEVMRAGLSVVLYRDRQELCWGLPAPLLAPVVGRDHTRSFHDNLSPAGGSLRTCLAADGRWIAMLDMARRRADWPFQPTDGAFLRLLAPTIGHALGAAFAREQAMRDAGAERPNASGILVLTPDRRVQLVTPAGEAWLRLLRDTQREGHAPLPTAVWSAVAGLRSSADARAACTVVAPSPAGPVRVEASPGGEDGSIAVVLASARPPAAPDIPDHWPLTQQERQVVTHLVRGLGNRQLATALGVSENTIESHLGHAYDKLGVRGRTQLLARLFRDSCWPAFRFPDDADDPEPGEEPSHP